jgi:hypothetical protein
MALELDKGHRAFQKSIASNLRVFGENEGHHEATKNRRIKVHFIFKEHILTHAFRAGKKSGSVLAHNSFEIDSLLARSLIDRIIN